MSYCCYCELIVLHSMYGLFCFFIDLFTFEKSHASALWRINFAIYLTLSDHSLIAYFIFASSMLYRHNAKRFARQWTYFYLRYWSTSALSPLSGKRCGQNLRVSTFIFFTITLANMDQFSYIFHCEIQKGFAEEDGIKTTTSPHICCHTKYRRNSTLEKYKCAHFAY